MKHLKNLKNKLNYRIFLKNKGLIDIYFNKKNEKETIKIFPLKDYNSHRLWQGRFQTKLLDVNVITTLKNFEVKYVKK